ncbi:hypothetical protein BDW02DRAFT_598040 [Decorospora gaudefroyi]|uniref:Uncharacterized protein n=1 Tax=Decorospora gaudefroyi TaxID=184978 RepID=A0A6A5KMB4_9PLEO|nr:hypothetical protein BDW02DRAFT_598040 [Decorospora gaudefroyi]
MSNVSDRTHSMQSTPTGSGTDDLAHVSTSLSLQSDALNDAECAQNAWSYEERTPAVSAIASEVARNAATTSSSANLRSVPSTQQASETKLDNPAEDENEEFGDFVSAPTDPFKQPVYSCPPDSDEDETCSLLNPHSSPSLHTPAASPDSTLSLLTTTSPHEIVHGIFAGYGLVAPVHASLDTSTRALRRAGKLALRRLQILRENRTRDAVEKAKELCKDDTAATEADIRELANVLVNVRREYEVGLGERHMDRKMDGIVRPVGIVEPKRRPQLGAEIEDMLETEREAWDA